MKLFRSVKHYLPETLPQERRSDLASVIESNGGQKAQTIHSATHIITNSYRFQGWQDVPQGVEIVTVRLKFTSPLQLSLNSHSGLVGRPHHDSWPTFAVGHVNLRDLVILNL
jgi:hypothetical protein